LPLGDVIAASSGAAHGNTSYYTRPPGSVVDLSDGYEIIILLLAHGGSRSAEQTHKIKLKTAEGEQRCTCQRKQCNGRASKLDGRGRRQADARRGWGQVDGPGRKPAINNL